MRRPDNIFLWPPGLFLVMGDFILDAELFAFQFGETKVVWVGPLVFFFDGPFEGGMFYSQ
jgi:hypothetical protein